MTYIAPRPTPRSYPGVFAQDSILAAHDLTIVGDMDSAVCYCSWSTDMVRTPCSIPITPATRSGGWC